MTACVRPPISQFGPLLRGDPPTDRGRRRADIHDDLRRQPERRQPCRQRTRRRWLSVERQCRHAFDPLADPRQLDRCPRQRRSQLHDEHARGTGRDATAPHHGSVGQQPDLAQERRGIHGRGAGRRAPGDGSRRRSAVSCPLHGRVPVAPGGGPAGPPDHPDRHRSSRRRRHARADRVFDAGRGCPGQCRTFTLGVRNASGFDLAGARGDSLQRPRPRPCCPRPAPRRSSSNRSRSRGHAWRPRPGWPCRPVWTGSGSGSPSRASRSRSCCPMARPGAGSAAWPTWRQRRPSHARPHSRSPASARRSRPH